IKMTRKLTRAQAIKEERRQKKWERYEQVMTLLKNGVSVKNIADQIGISYRTAQRLVHAEAFPEASTRVKRRKIIEPYRRHLDERWESGCHNATQLFREVQAQGFQGSYGVVYAYLSERYEPGTRGLGEGGARASHRLCSVPSPRQMAWLFLYPDKSLALTERREGLEVSQKQAAVLHQLLAGDSPLKTAILLARQFIEMVTQRQPEVLDAWIQAAIDSGLEELGRFARSIVQDYAAIRAALELDISNGQVEGQVNRLKTLKRQMYGRAGLELLKARLMTPLIAPV
ncbi:MAG TPA: transposase, partial [Abditibacteriaceae bacterium]|nr:transposase [Abditibacteriaceae bacterium]